MTENGGESETILFTNHPQNGDQTVSETRSQHTRGVANKVFNRFAKKNYHCCSTTAIEWILFLPKQSQSGSQCLPFIFQESLRASEPRVPGRASD